MWMMKLNSNLPLLVTSFEIDKIHYSLLIKNGLLSREPEKATRKWTYKDLKNGHKVNYLMQQM